MNACLSTNKSGLNTAIFYQEVFQCSSELIADGLLSNCLQKVIFQRNYPSRKFKTTLCVKCTILACKRAIRLNHLSKPVWKMGTIFLASYFVGNCYIWYYLHLNCCLYKVVRRLYHIYQYMYM